MTKQKNLFGEMQEVDESKRGTLSHYQQVKKRNKFGPSRNNVERCHNCVNLLMVRGNTKNYYKCKLIGTSSSEATDVRLRDACNKFKHV